MLARLRKWIFGNWALKLLSLGSPFLVWAADPAEPMAEIGYQVPIEFHNLSPDLEISGDVPAQAYVRVRGRSMLLRRLTPADLAIRVDLAGKAAGETAVKISPDQIAPPYGATVVRISPAQLRLRLVTRKETLPAPPR